jgi:lipopolysaccharide biosynthesis regulator YciM
MKKSLLNIRKLFQEILKIFVPAIELGYYYHSQGKIDQSSEIFSNLGKRSDTDMDVLRILVSFYLDEEQYEKAMVIIDGMLSGSP